MSIKRAAAGRRIGVVLALALTVSSTSPAAWAQPAQTADAVKEAESRFKEGLKRHDAGDEEGARLSFLQAFSVLKRANILFNLARAEQLTNHPVDAIGHYKLYVADSTVTAVDRETARKRIVELSALVGHIVINAPSGADLWIDGQMLPSKAPLGEPADAAGGMHTVQARLGDQTKTATVACSPGQTVTVKIEIEGTPGTGLVVVPMPGEGGAVPVAPAPLQEEPLHYETSRAKVVTTVGLGVASLVFIGVGVGMQVAAGGKGSDAASLQGGPSSCLGAAGSSTRCTGLASAVSSQVSDENARTGAFFGAGVFAAAALVTWLAWPNAKVVEGSRARHLVPIVSPGVAGLGFVTTFE